MKLILSGYQGSQKIITASSYFYKKYFDANYELIFTSYGEEASIELCKGSILYLAKNQIQSSHSWSTYLSEFLKKIDDRYIIFGLDDYFLSNYVDLCKYNEVIKNFIDTNFDLLRLDVSIDKTLGDEFNAINAGYIVTTQLSVWKVSTLIKVLSFLNTPWEFEDCGTKIFKYLGFKAVVHAEFRVEYPVNSSISARHQGKVSVVGNGKNDVEGLISDGLLNRSDLVLGMSPGVVPDYELLDAESMRFEGYYTNNDREHYIKMLIKTRNDKDTYKKFIRHKKYLNLNAINSLKILFENLKRKIRNIYIRVVIKYLMN
jgi:hypothetical protein